MSLLIMIGNAQILLIPVLRSTILLSEENLLRIIITFEETDGSFPTYE